MLVAVQRISLESYDTILVDWDQENEAIALLKNARDQKTAGHALNIALVKNDKDLPRALQHGANSAIRKPVDPRLAKDTLSTARDLILSRRTEQKTKEERIAAAQAAIAAATAELATETSAPAPKTGFVTQTAPRSAWEAAESSEQNSSGEPQPQASRPVSPAAEPESEVEESAPLPRKRWDDKPRPQEVPRVNVAPPETETLIAEIPRSQDATGVFSSLPEEVEEEPRAEPEKQSQPRYLVYALVGCLLVAAALWVWAPGSSFHGVATSLMRKLHPAGQTAVPPASGPVSAVQPMTPEIPVPAPTSAALEESAPADTAPIESSEVDPDKLQVIETKSIPKPGAQQAAGTDAPAQPDPSQPQTQPQIQPAPSATASPTDASANTAQPPTPAPVQIVVVPVAKPLTPPTTPVHENSLPASAGRTGVIIPDSLKASPSSTPGNSVESGVVPEETSRNLIDQRVEPVYPAQALSQRLEGPVVLQVWVAKDGTVSRRQTGEGLLCASSRRF